MLGEAREEAFRTESKGLGSSPLSHQHATLRAFCNGIIKLEFRFVNSPIRFAVSVRESRCL